MYDCFRSNGLDASTTGESCRYGVLRTGECRFAAQNERAKRPKYCHSMRGQADYYLLLQPDYLSMRRDYHNWYSHRLGHQMELLAFGHGGAPILVFPSSRGRFFEYENTGMVQALSGKIDAGNIQLFCVDSADGESWYNRGLHPHDRVMRHGAYENYILYEVVPLIKGVNCAQQISTTGVSLGAYHALNFGLRHPDVTSRVVAMSGTFDMRPFMDGYYDQDFYFNNPVDYIPNMNDSWFLDHYHRMNIVMGVGDWDICLGENFKMAEILGKKGIPHWLDVWTGGQQHDWPLWQRMAVKFF